MHVWNVLHAARWKYRTQKIAKNRHLSTIAQICRAIFLQLRHVSIIGNKFVKQKYFLHVSSQYGELQPASGLRAPPANFNGFRVLTSLLQRRRSTKVNQTLHDVWPSPGLVHYTFLGFFSPNGILPGAKFTLCQSLAFSYIPHFGQIWVKISLLGVLHPCRCTEEEEEEESAWNGWRGRQCDDHKVANEVALNIGLCTLRLDQSLRLPSV